MATPLDRIIRVLFAAANEPRDTRIKLKFEDLSWLCLEAIKVLKADPILIELEAPVTVVGDIHGQFYDLLEFFKLCGNPPETRYLCLGDYVDRGNNSIETFSLLLALKVKYPKAVFLLRGNHETQDISRIYGFFAECSERYSQQMWDMFVNVFQYLPLAAIISNRIFCVHGGLSPDLSDLQQIREIRRPVDIAETGMLADLLWADPSNEHTGYSESERGTAYTFGQDIAQMFIDNNDFDLLCRGHQVVDKGFEFPFWPDQSVLTVFSAPDYCGEFGNMGAVLQVDEQLHCSFQFVAPVKKATKISFRSATPTNRARA